MTEKKPPYKSFWLSDKTRSELAFLVTVYGENQSAIIKRLIAEAYIVQNALLKQSDKNEGKQSQ